jgi:formylglycine-generating enzyme required for sulfatase activity
MLQSGNPIETDLKCDDTNGTSGRIFISYSRIDRDFAQLLISILLRLGHDAYIDEKDIEPGEPWQDRLSKLILGSTVVVFVLTKDSAASSVCRWEVEEAVRLKKRILPVVPQRFSHLEAPRELARLNFIFFDNAEAIDSSAITLDRAIRVDLPWLREHTRLAELATSWDQNGRRQSDLLRGPALEQAGRWMISRPDDAPGITDLQRLFLAEGRRLARSRQRNWVFALTGTAVALLLASFGAVYGAYRDDVDAFVRWLWHGLPMVRQHFLPFRLVSSHAARPFTQFRECDNDDLCPEIVMPAPTGGFSIGYLGVDRKYFRSDQEKRATDMRIIHAFAIARTPVSESQWFTCIRSGICRSEPGDIGAPSLDPTRPMRGLSKAQADQYAEWMSKATGAVYRLPSEVEYEYSTRAGSQTIFSWGDDFDPSKVHCRFDGDCQSNGLRDEPVSPKRFMANKWGLFSTNGNVFQWMADCYTSNLNQLPSDGRPYTKEGCATFTVRGGSFLSTAGSSTSSFRIDYTMGSKPRNLGARVVRLMEGK